MKTTLNIITEVKRVAACQGRTVFRMVAVALRLLPRSRRKQETRPTLPSFHSCGVLVDIADRDALYHTMEGLYAIEKRTQHL